MCCPYRFPTVKGEALGVLGRQKCLTCGIPEATGKICLYWYCIDPRKLMYSWSLLRLAMCKIM
jgi:hypothetical protein